MRRDAHERTHASHMRCHATEDEMRRQMRGTGEKQEESQGLLVSKFSYRVVGTNKFITKPYNCSTGVLLMP